MTLTTLLDADAIARAAQPLESAWTLPPAAYLEPQVYAAEEQRLFRAGWVCVARAEQLQQPGDYVASTVGGQPVVVVCEAPDTLRALSRVCLHRAMPLVEGTGNTRSLLCPYHRWNFGLDGSLRAAPHMEGVAEFERSQCSLPTYPLAVWQGFVFVNVDGQAAELTPQLSGLDRLLKDYHFSELVLAETLEYDSPWNWKVLVENFIEAYHHAGPHRHSLEPSWPGHASEAVTAGDAPWVYLHMPAKASAATSQDDHQPTSFPHLSATQRGNLMAACVFPHFMIATSSALGLWYEVVPESAASMTLRIHLLVHPALLDTMTAEQRAEMRAGIDAFHHEDIAANLGVWQGLQAPHTRQGRLSLLEKAIWQFNGYWIRNLA